MAIVKAECTKQMLKLAAQFHCLRQSAARIPHHDSHTFLKLRPCQGTTCHHQGEAEPATRLSVYFYVFSFTLSTWYSAIELQSSTW